MRLEQNFVDQPSRVRFTLRAYVVDDATRQVIAWREFDTRVAAVRDDPVAGVQAAQEAAQRLLKAVATFCAMHSCPSSP